MDEFEERSVLQSVAVSGENFSEGHQLASGWALKQVSCSLGAVADQLRGAEQLVLGGRITVCKGRRQAVSFCDYVGSGQAENR